MRQDKKQKDIPAITLVLCFCLMALVSVFVVKANVDKIRDTAQSNKAADVVKEKAVEENTETEADIVDSLDSTDSGADDTESQNAAEFTAPLSGEIIMDFSMDMPIYQKTLDQYMTHSGIDIAAPEGTGVSACAAGTVTRIEEDDKLGIVVEINHGNNLLSVYGNLAGDDLIELGEIVSKGDTIGKVGRTSLFEFGEDDHLHFEMRKNGDPVAPGSYIKGL